MATDEFGAYLRSRRAATHPEDVGIPSGGYRRVQGLRREEVAVLAGVSVDYYARLEQGRERHPSPQVLEALSRTFNLDRDAKEHLYRLARISPTVKGYTLLDTVSPDLLRLMDNWPATPAYVLNRTMDILAHNQLARQLHAGFERADNIMRMVFLDPAGRQFFVDRERSAHACVVNLRLAAGHDPHDPRLAELLAELRGNAEFRAIWDSGEVRGKSHGAKEFHHPEVGRLHLNYQVFDVRNAPGQQLTVYQAEPGSPSAEALTLLGAIAATRAASAS
jgi:transcriptional regulator with XRE-family HTH domain